MLMRCNNRSVAVLMRVLVVFAVFVVAPTASVLPVTDYANAKAFFANEGDNLRFMHAQGWINDAELVEMLDEVQNRFCRNNPSSRSCKDKVSGTNPTTTESGKPVNVSKPISASSSSSTTAAGNVEGSPESWPLERVGCSIGRYNALACRAGIRTEPLAMYRSGAQMCDVWNSMCNASRIKLLQIAIPKAASTSFDNVLRMSPELEPCYVPLCCDHGTIQTQLDYANNPKHEVQYMTNAQQMRSQLGLSCTPDPGQCKSPGWSLSTKYQQPCNYVSAHSSFYDSEFAEQRGINNVQVVTMLREPVERVRSAFLYTAKRDWASGKHTLGTHAHPEDMDIDDFLETNTLYAGNNLQTRLIAGTKQHHRNQTANADTLRRAKENLRTMAFFGIAERFDDSVCLLRHSAFGEDVLRINEGWDDESIVTRANVRTGMYIRNGLQFSDVQMEKARASRFLRYDIELYDFAVQLFEERLAAMPQCSSTNRAPASLSTSIGSGETTEVQDRQPQTRKKKRKKKKRHRTEL